MGIKLKDLAKIIDGEVCGDGEILITGVSGIKEACEGDITFLANPRYNQFLKTTKASAVIVSPDAPPTPRTKVVSTNPYLSFIKAVEYFYPQQMPSCQGIHPTAVIYEDVQIGKGVTVGAHCVIEAGSKIGDGTVIMAGTYIGKSCSIGRNCLIYPNVTVREGIVIGDRVIIHCGAVIGSDGFGFIRDGEVYRKIPQVGNVVIEDDVEVGANVTIDRATTGTTRVGSGTKIDNLVQIGHNVTIGRNCIIVAQVGIGGTTEIGDGVTLAGQAGIAGHLRIGDNAVVAAQAGVIGDVKPGTTVSGYPARQHKEARRIYASLPKLPELVKRVSDLAARVSKLESQKNE